MKKLGKVLEQTSWFGVSNTLNNNSDTLYEAITQLENATIKNAGYFLSQEALESAVPNPKVGMTAFIYDAQQEKYIIWEVNAQGSWEQTDYFAQAPNISSEEIKALQASVDEVVAEQSVLANDVLTNSNDIEELQKAIITHNNQLSSVDGELEALKQGKQDKLAHYTEEDENATIATRETISLYTEQQVSTASISLDATTSEVEISSTNHNAEQARVYLNNGNISIDADSKVSMSCDSGETVIEDVVGTIKEIVDYMAKDETDDGQISDTLNRHEARLEELTNSVQGLQDDTEDLQSMRDTIDRLGTDKADKSALEETNNEVAKKQNQLNNYKENSGDSGESVWMGVEYTEDGKTISSAHVASEVNSGMYYAERNSAKTVIHEDHIYMQKEQGEHAKCIVMKSYQNDGEGGVRETQLHMNPDELIAKNGNASVRVGFGSADLSHDDGQGGFSLAGANGDMAYLVSNKQVEITDLDENDGIFFTPATEDEPSKISMTTDGNTVDDVVGTIIEHGTLLNTLNGTGEGSVSKTVTDKIAEVVAGAPTDLDTLKEIADYIKLDNTNAANVATSLNRLNKRVYELGDFPTSGAAENAAKDPSVSGNNEIVIMRYTVSRISKQGIFIQQVGDYRTVQYQIWDASIYTRHIWFTDNSRRTINTGYNNNWWRIGGTHIKYDPSTRKIGLENMNNGMMNPDNTATLPLATRTQAGLMTAEQVTALEGKQDKLQTYQEVGTEQAVMKAFNSQKEVAVGVDIEGGVIIGVGEVDGEVVKSLIHVTNEAISMSSPNGEIKDVVKEIADKAPKVGYAPDLKVNFAKELVGRGEATEEVIGGIRPTGVRSIGDGNATIERIKGESVVWNQCMNITRVYPQFDEPLYTITHNDDRYYITKQEGGAQALDNLCVAFSHEFKKGQKYLLRYNLRRNDGQNLSISFQSSGIYDGTSYHDLIKVYRQDYVFFSPTSSFTSILMQVSQPVTAGVALSYTIAPVIHDLTLMFGSGNEPTTIEDFEARRPLGVTNEYNEGTIVSYDGDALKSVGFNAWNEEWEVGAVTTSGLDWNDKTTSIRTKYVQVVPNQTYEISYPSQVTVLQGVMYDKDKKMVGSAFFGLQGKSASITTLSECRYIRVSWVDYLTSTIKEYQHDICIHLKHTYTPEKYPNGYAPYEADTHPLPDVKSILDANGNKLFPYGLLSAGSVHDEITATKAIKRIGVVDMGTLNWSLSGGLFQYRIPSFSYKTSGNILCVRYPYVSRSAVESTDKSMSQNTGDSIIVIKDSSYTTTADFKAAMSGVLLYYELATPIEVDLPEKLNMTYEAWDFGTEELVYDTPTTPLNAEIVYQFNAVDRIRENTTKNKELEDRIAALEAMITQLTTQTTNDGETDNEQM